MKFAQFQSTYKNLPLDVFERTGQELETKYYKNREASSLLRQGLSNAKVEDRNIGILAKATNDVENKLNGVNGKWHYASNILFDAKDRIVNDKALSASLEDYAKSQASKAEQQKLMQDGKIGQEALEAYYTNDKRYNNKSVEIDENGQVKNRWATPVPPPKVDTEKKVLEIVTLLSRNKDSLAIGATKEGTPLYEIYKSNPGLEGYVNQYSAKGKSPETIANAVKAWLASTPEVKAYYDYVNDARVFSLVTERDAEGNYLKDEMGEFIQKDLTPQDFRELGIQVDDNWKSKSDKIILPGVGGALTSSIVKALDPNFKETPLYKEYIEQGLTDKQATQQIYKKVLTDLQTDKIVDFSRQFGFSEMDVKVNENKRYWFDAEWNRKQLESRSIHNTWEGLSPMYKDDKFDSLQTLKTIQAKQKELNAMPDVTPIDKLARRTKQNEIDDLQSANTFLIDSFNKVEGQHILQTAYDALSSNMNDADVNVLKNNKEKVFDFISGKTSELNLPFSKELESTSSEYPRAFTKEGEKISLGTDIQSRLESARNQYLNSLNKKVQTDGLNITATTTTFLDKEGGISKISQNIGNNIIKLASSWEFPSAYGKQGEKITLADFMKDKGIDAAKYDLIAEPTDPTGSNPGYYAIKIIPKSGVAGADKLEAFDKIVVRPNAANRTSILNSIAEIVAENSANDKGLAWAVNAKAAAMFGDYITPIKHDLAVQIGAGFTSGLQTPRKIFNVPSRMSDPTKTSNFEIRPNGMGSLDVYQIDANTGISNLVIKARDLNEVQLGLYELYSKN